PSPSAATAIAPRCSGSRWTSASSPRGAGGSSRATSSTRDRSPRSARSSPRSAARAKRVSNSQLSRLNSQLSTLKAQRSRLNAPASTLKVESLELIVAVLVSVLAFVLYRATMLPGFEFGDTGSFQATVGSPFITPRDGYPLYFAVGQLFLWVTRAEPAHALNLASAFMAAIACGLIVLVGAELSGSIAAGAGAALLFGASY